MPPLFTDGAILPSESKLQEGKGDFLFIFVSPVLVYTAGALQMLMNEWVKLETVPNGASRTGLPCQNRKFSRLKLRGVPGMAVVMIIEILLVSRH